MKKRKRCLYPVKLKIKTTSDARMERRREKQNARQLVSRSWRLDMPASKTNSGWLRSGPVSNPVSGPVSNPVSGPRSRSAIASGWYGGGGSVWLVLTATVGEESIVDFIFVVGGCGCGL